MGAAAAKSTSRSGSFSSAKNAVTAPVPQAMPHTITFYWPLDCRVNILGQRLSNLHSVLLDQELSYEIVVQTYFNDHIIDRSSPLITGRYDGAIIAGASDADIRQLEDLSFSTPVVLMNMDSRKYSSVSISHEPMGLQVASLLHKKGYQECAIVKSVELLSLGMQEPETMRYLTPSISCVSVPPNVDKQAMMILLQLMQQGSSEPIHVELEPLVQLRESFTLPADS